MFRNLFRKKPDAPEPKPPTDAELATPPPEAPSEPVAVSEPTEKRGFFQRLKEGLAKTRKNFVSQLGGLLRFGRTIDEELFEEMEEVLIQADVGVKTTLELIERLRKDVRERGMRDASQLEPLLKTHVLDILGNGAAFLDVANAKPFVLLVVGVNGVGKTTTIGKLAARFKSEGKRVLVAAGDTFRAAAIDQLEVWCDRAGAELIRQSEGSDAASVVYDAIHAARARSADLLIVDTAGRLHTKKNLMAELGKINRVIGREIPGAPHETLIVLDATTGQNAVIQAKEFHEMAPLTGIALTKLDSTAKGGIIIAVRHELGIPVKLIGIGEKIEDLRDFEPKEFVEALFADDEEAA